MPPRRRIEAPLERAGATLAALRAEAGADLPDPEAPGADRGAGGRSWRRSSATAKPSSHASWPSSSSSWQQAGTRAGARGRGVDEARPSASAPRRRLEAARRPCARPSAGSRRRGARPPASAASSPPSTSSCAATTALPGGGRALADELEVDPGYELAVAAALDGRLGAAVVADRAAAGALLDRAGPTAGEPSSCGSASCQRRRAPDSRRPRAPSRCRSTSERRAGAVALARSLLADTWVVETSTAARRLPGRRRHASAAGSGRRLAGAAPGARRRRGTRAGRAQPPRRAGRGQRGRGAEPSSPPATTLERAAAAVGRARCRPRARVAAHRDAVADATRRPRQQRRLAAQIERRRAAPDEGPAPVAAPSSMAELAAERSALDRVERERAERQARIERLRGAIARDEALAPPSQAVLDALEALRAAIAERRAGVRGGAGRRPRGGRARRRASCGPARRRRRRSTPSCSARTRRSPRPRCACSGPATRLADAEHELRAAGRPARARGRARRPSARRGRARGARRPARAPGPAARAARPGQPAGAGGVRRGGRARRGARAPAHRPRDRAARAREADRRHRPPDPRDLRADLRGRRRATSRSWLSSCSLAAAAGCASSPSARARARVLGGQAPAERRGRRRRPRGEREGGDGGGEATRGGPARRRDRDHAGRQGDEAPDAALRRREVDDRAGLPVRRVPRPAVPVLHPRRGRGRARRPQHRSLPRPAATATPSGPSSSSSPTRSGRWRRPTRSTASRWAATGSRR